MIRDFIPLGAGALSQIGPHDEFLELCAVSTSGELTEEEQKKLQGHLAVCASCREVLRQYESVVDQAIPGIAANQQPESESVAPDHSWSQEQAERDLFDCLAREEQQEREQGNGSNISLLTGRVPPVSSDSWNHMWMLYAAGILLFLALSLFTYRVGLHHGSNVTTIAPPPSQPTFHEQTALQEQLSDAGYERAVARAQMEQRDKSIADLRRQLARQSDEISQMRAAQEQLESQLRTETAGKQDLLAKQTELTKKLEIAESGSHTLQGRLDTLAQQSAQDAARAKASDAKISDLTKLLQDREAALEQQDQLLAHDRDIRELMGARDLYIAEVYDVAGTGETKKPYGRVFYTRGKSLIFYAYDLDQQAELKKAKAFQAWGRRGPDRRQAVNLGIFYEDNASRKRWILKCDDPKTLAQIDGVFVTVEPNGGSHKPSNQTLLFAYLKVNPNHP
jgi:hypothetical protein